ncbi:YpbS family protein [Priestia filamentosa]|uniref:YpbS family protein n=1 Tax=Priestia filamentosa TaxID=1402861 RepID=UPI001FB2626E|nr:YpbS family protein [Priestia filamentosa]UOE59544.1 YpbS family protein [Priestia filamentosa]
MSVHKAITKHSQSQHEKVKKFAELESIREFEIDQAVSKCRNGETFSVDAINAVTKRINELAKKGIVPTRKLVTKEMVKEYVERLEK